MESIIGKFWRKANNQFHGLHFKIWDSISTSQDIGGLDLQKLEPFNKGMVAKQIQQVISNKDSLFSNCIFGKSRKGNFETLLTKDHNPS